MVNQSVPKLRTPKVSKDGNAKPVTILGQDGNLHTLPYSVYQSYYNKGWIILRDGKQVLTKVYEPKKIQTEQTEKELINFNFSTTNITEKNVDILRLREIIVQNFPTIWFETKACLSAYASLSLKNLNGCPSLNLVGNPSGEKTTVLSFFYGQSNSYISDDFTPASFVSHATNVKKEELSSIDLLPKLQDKVLLTPELAPLFEASKDELLNNFAILTRVLDGEGLNRDSGAHGHRGYSGDYKFIWLGATTPIKSAVWQTMGKMGNRLFFLNMSEKNRTTQDYVNMFLDKPYSERVEICRSYVRTFLDAFFKENPKRSIRWETDDPSIISQIVEYGKLLARLRGSFISWKSGEDSQGYQFTSPLIEEPPRAINAFLNFARGHALIHGRRYLDKSDLELVRRICFSSMPHDRSLLLNVLLKHGGRATSKTIEDELTCSDSTANRTMNAFKVLGICDLKSLPGEFGGRPLSFIELKPEFLQVLLDSTHPHSNGENPFPQNLQGVQEWEKYQKEQGTHSHSNGENPFPRRKLPVRKQIDLDGINEVLF